MRKLVEPTTALANFYASGVLALAGQTGPFLWQLPATFRFDEARIATFLEALPRTAGEAAALAAQHDARLAGDRALTTTTVPDLALRHAFEVRHESFRDPAFAALLRRHDVALVLSDNPGTWPVFDEVTAPFAYVRLHGHEQLYASGYDDDALDAWAAKVRAWDAAGLDVYVYCDNERLGAGALRRDGPARPARRRGSGRSAGTLGRVSAQIRAVLFDCDGVLQRPANDWAAEIGRLTGLGGDELDRFLDDVSTAEQPVLDGSEPFAGPLARVLGSWGLAPDAEDLVAVWQHLDVDAAMLDAVRALRARGLRCAIATNQHRERGVYMRRELGYERLFDPMVVSAEIGVAKPDPAYFERAVELVGLPAEQVLFVDDVAANVESARTVGLVAEHFAKDAGRSELDRILALHDLGEPVAA